MVALVGYSILTTIALVWMLGRASVDREVATPQQAARQPILVSKSALQPKTEPIAKPIYPLFQSTTPKIFLGSWDEIISDKCAGRESRFYFGARDFMNFEVTWEVTKVKLYSPTEIDLHTTMYDENKNQVDTVWHFRVVDGGKTLTSRKPGGSFFKRCPADAD